mmetsp:Transcript_41023/g.162269  ORF Transcript_41023/g.162269 Transcript_41023/m.162269 type:complete len:165 (-) Transcript_41023:420-914(-)|eukprot:CAMPEP_0113954604 /NCGR_PEP_ID=MMETSP0011_2-20120614/680_1 /TAXON_ID=101924 /ORGANISM="Rhodosorus marinus" /LENGTH=164 /DNA_ID=CAMNT_0000963821 /DNA_START=145 /DNA_END=639 /DNA_ORIENTATION=+ /assembly_acc=CAM_ASM_000156
MAFVLCAPVLLEAKRQRHATACSARKGFGKAPPCVCGVKKPYEECCGAIHERRRKAEFANELMRARYSAYQKALVGFIMETTTGVNESEDSEKWRAALFTYVQATKFKGLKVLKSEKGAPGDDEGYVTFSVKTNSGSYTERSRFLPDDEFGWKYVREPEDSPTQ